MVLGMEIKPYKTMLRECGMFSLEKKRLIGFMIVIFKYLKACHMANTAHLFFSQPKRIGIARIKVIGSV